MTPYFYSLDRLSPKNLAVFASLSPRASCGKTRFLWLYPAPPKKRCNSRKEGDVSNCVMPLASWPSNYGGRYISRSQNLGFLFSSLFTISLASAQMRRCLPLFPPLPPRTNLQSRTQSMFLHLTPAKTSAGSNHAPLVADS